ncbi:MAG: PEP-CTERM sorting domain-containing protein [Armatimonadetes bacterium]|nr:PEP-CTERM sorting domain-containing protein [Armatimonadota bacterium]
MKRKHLVSVVAAAGIASVSSATNLLWMDVAGGSLSQTDFVAGGYGHRVTSTVMGNYQYGSEGGFTPNISASYTPDSGPWGSGYGDLPTAMWGVQAASSGAPNDHPVSMTLSADPGWFVQLRSIRLADWSGSTSDQTTLRALDGNNNELFSWTGIPDTNTNTLIVFPNVVAQTVTLTWNNAWHTGGRELIFSQTDSIPEPATLALLGAAGFAALRRRR